MVSVSPWDNWDKPLPDDVFAAGMRDKAKEHEMIPVLRNKHLTDKHKWQILKKMGVITHNFVSEKILSAEMYDWLLSEEQNKIENLTVFNIVACFKETPHEILMRMTKHHFSEVRTNAVQTLLKIGSLPQQDYPLEWIEEIYGIHFDYPDEIVWHKNRAVERNLREGVSL